jgi:hypothetical protein
MIITSSPLPSERAARKQVNQEMVALESLLRALPALVKPLGRVGMKRKLAVSWLAHAASPTGV